MTHFPSLIPFNVINMLLNIIRCIINAWFLDRLQFIRKHSIITEYAFLRPDSGLRDVAIWIIRTSVWRIQNNNT